MKGRNGDSNHNLPIKSVVKPDSEREMFVGFFKFQFSSSNHTFVTYKTSLKFTRDYEVWGD